MSLIGCWQVLLTPKAADTLFSETGRIELLDLVT
jgi:hypothetical protein